MTFANVRKFALAALGGLAQVAAAGLLPEQYRPWATVVLAVATALGVYAVPNAPLPYVAKHESV